jgi:hypothetical protein
MEDQVIALVNACKQAMYHFTCESEEQWRESQSYDEAPYYFLYKAIVDAEEVLP